MLGVAACTLMVALLVAWVPASSLADGDPASDVLLTQELFLPWDAGVSTAQQDQLTAILQAAARSGYQLRVALIASASDLGSVTELWQDPRAYAEFLGEELSLVYRGTLLVAMPNGFGLYRSSGLAAAEGASLASAGIPGSGTHLGSATLGAIQSVAAASGHKLPVVRGVPTSDVSASGANAPSDDTLPWIAFVIGCVLIASTWAASLRARPLRAHGHARSPIGS